MFYNCTTTIRRGTLYTVYVKNVYFMVVTEIYFSLDASHHARVAHNIMN